MVDHRRRDDAAQGPQAGDGDGRARQLIASGRAAAHRLRQPADLGRHGPEVARLGVAHHRHHQPAVALRGDADRALICGKSRNATTMARAKSGSNVSLPRDSPHFWLSWTRKSSSSVTSISST
ncbi:hypothetical protein G6F31_020328 [Rhizopus arrhizus]|nr:hypothetical protein G6F31_020328 [Rhizopus arrhizus]